ncbi:hypothetical protein Pcinc_014564 [Petrolisthes cinctipes]|uniref:Uncharacterized protein n=1 Tax=Petrolisthes cinctipes TaxID=88211 RepID=A0AAE1KR97_PETCI|nr:hypothetical protein Pcinc_014564 [Petrolisthes cinctipes]
MLSLAKPPQHSPGSQNSSSDSTESKPFASLSHAESRQTSRNALSRQPISRGGRIMYARGKGQNAELTGGGRGGGECVGIPREGGRQAAKKEVTKKKNKEEENNCVRSRKREEEGNKEAGEKEMDENK